MQALAESNVAARGRRAPCPHCKRKGFANPGSRATHVAACALRLRTPPASPVTAALKVDGATDGTFFVRLQLSLGPVPTAIDAMATTAAAATSTGTGKDSRLLPCPHCKRKGFANPGGRATHVAACALRLRTPPASPVTAALKVDGATDGTFFVRLQLSLGPVPTAIDAMATTAAAATSTGTGKDSWRPEDQEDMNAHMNLRHRRVPIATVCNTTAAAPVHSLPDPIVGAAANASMHNHRSLVLRVLRHMADHGTDQTQLAPKIPMARSSLSRWLSSELPITRFDGPIEAFLDRVTPKGHTGRLRALGQDVYKVESLIAVRHKGSAQGRGREFRVRWQGYGPESDTWEAECALPCRPTTPPDQRNHQRPFPLT